MARTSSLSRAIRTERIAPWAFRPWGLPSVTRSNAISHYSNQKRPFTPPFQWGRIPSIINGTVTDTSNKTTDFAYNSVGRTSLTVALPSGGQQTTEWIYGVTTSGGSSLNSNDLIKEVRYPDPSTGISSSTEKETITVNALGQKLTVTDRNGTTHS